MTRYTTNLPADRGAELTEAELLRRLNEQDKELERLRTALEIIRRDYGHVCEDFDTCAHVACNDSFATWHLANDALGEKELPVFPFGELEALHADLATAHEHVGALVASNRAMHAAMQDYAMDVDEEPPYTHKEMMRQAQIVDAAARAWLRRAAE